MSETMEPVESIDTGADGGKVWGYPQPQDYTPVVLPYVPSTKFGFLKVNKHYDVGSFVITLLFVSLINIASSVFSYFLIKIYIDEPATYLFVLAAIVSSIASCLFRGISDSVSDYRFDALAFVAFLFVSYASYPIAVNMKESTVTEDVLYQQEYGYQEIDAPLEEPAGTVVDADGETVEIGVYTYKGQNILFETPEQLQEKMVEVDAGTFLKGETDE